MPVEARWDIEDERRSLMPASHLARRRARVPRRARIALLAAAGALVAMAAILAAASALPVPEPAPTPTPHSAFEAAAIEAEALARGDRSAFLSVQDSADIPWFTAQRESFQAWGEPPRGLAYDLMDSGGLPGGRVWIIVRQYRAGEYVVETRVYQRRGPRWMRVRPDAWLDDSPGAFDTVHFHVEFPANMQRDALRAAAQFERAYNRLCLDLGCRPGPGDYRDDVYGSSIYPRALNMTLVLEDRLAFPSMLDAGQRVTVTLPAVDAEWQHFALDSLAVPLARLASGGTPRWSSRSDGELIVTAIVGWERGRLLGDAAQRPSSAGGYGGLAGEELVPLRALWSWPLRFPPDSILMSRLRREAASMIDFIAGAYGPSKVAALLRAVEPARSLPEAVEAALPVGYDAFERDWREWLARLK